MKSIENITDNEINEYYKLIGRNIKKQRNKKGLTQLELSNLMNLKSVGLISQGELYLNKQHFNLKHLYYLAYILECDISSFFEEEIDLLE